MRIWFLSILMGMVMLSVLATDLYLPSLPSLVTYFGTSQVYVQLSLSLYLAAFAFSILLMGPLSDRFGRRTVFLTTITVDLCGSLVCLFAPNIEYFLTGRILQAFGGSGGTVLGRIIARDLFEGSECTKVLAYLFTAVSCAIAVTPALGGLLQQTFGWRASFILLLSYSATLLLSASLGLKETIKEGYRKPFHLKNILSNYGIIIKNVEFRYFCCLITLIWSGFFAFVTGSSFIYIEALKQTADFYGSMFALIMGGMILGTLLAAHYLHRLRQQSSIFLGIILCTGSGICLFFIPPSVLMISILMAIYQLGCGILLPFCQMGATRSLPTLTSSNFSLLYFAKMLGGSLAGILVGFFSYYHLYSMNFIIGFFAILSFFIFLRMVKLRIFVASALSQS